MDPSATMQGQNDNGEAVRPLANFHPDIWGDTFFNQVALDEVTQNRKEQEVTELKEKVRRELFMVEDPKDRLLFIDAIQRLGVAYHFEQEIEAILQQLHQNCVGDLYEDDLLFASLRFRLLRQHGFSVSCDAFDKFKDENGNFKACLTSDSQGVLSLYEASHLKLRGEIVLHDALAFTMTHLKSLASSSSPPLDEQINHALKRPLYRCSTRLEAKYQISIYNSNASSHHEALLRFAKFDFNLLQLLHKKELSDLTRWAKSLDFKGKFPFARDRVVEGYIWTLGVYYEPKYSSARIKLNKVFKIMNAIDDMYDAYGTVEELEPFTKAILRWDSDCMNQLPDYMKMIHQILLDTVQDFEMDLADEGRSSNVVDHFKKELEVSCQAYLQEAKWCHEKYVPTYDEYMKNAIVSCIYCLMIIASYLGIGELETKDAIGWINLKCKAVKASCLIARLVNDLGGHKDEQKRKHVASAVECYKKKFGVSEEEAYKEIQQQVEEAWNDLKEEMFGSTTVPMPLLKRILNITSVLHDAYELGDDGFTKNIFMKPKVIALLIDPAI